MRPQNEEIVLLAQATGTQENDRELELKGLLIRFKQRIVDAIRSNNRVWIGGGVEFRSLKGAEEVHGGYEKLEGSCRRIKANLSRRTPGQFSSIILDKEEGAPLVEIMAFRITNRTYVTWP